MESMSTFHNHSERIRVQYENVALFNEALMQTEQVDFTEKYIYH